MTVAQWIKENKKFYEYDELTIVDEDNKIILDDRLAYLKSRSNEYNKAWKAKCRGKQIKETKQVRNAIVLVVG